MEKVDQDSSNQRTTADKVSRVCGILKLKSSAERVVRFLSRSPLRKKKLDAFESGVRLLVCNVLYKKIV